LLSGNWKRTQERDKEVWSFPVIKYYCLYSGKMERLGIFACPKAHIYLCSVGLSISAQRNKQINTEKGSIFH